VILVDTSIWIDYLRAGEPELADLLAASQVLVHPFIVGELALGNLNLREQIITTFEALPQAVQAHHGEVMGLIIAQKLFGLGIGYVDAHLIASTLLTTGSKLWTRDRQLATAAGRVGVAWNMPQ
jgi:predicted nucleic acid-binding protein